MKPLVSVMIPAYNSAETLPIALASLMAQTYQHWEGIVVDDGSEDETSELIARLQKKDHRIRCHKFADNQGRGAARQFALQNATGEFLAFLDADDWIFPDKLEKQLTAFFDLPNVALVSTGMAIVDAKQELVGVRINANSSETLVLNPPIKRIPVQIPFAPSMVRMGIARQIGFNRSLRRAEDQDFMWHVLQSVHWAILPSVTYVYSEIESVDYQNIKETHDHFKILLNGSDIKIVDKIWLNARIDLLSVIYGSIFALGFGDWLIKRRSRRPTLEEQYEFNVARKQVTSVLKSLEL